MHHIMATKLLFGVAVLALCVAFNGCIVAGIADDPELVGVWEQQIDKNRDVHAKALGSSRKGDVVAILFEFEANGQYTNSYVREADAKQSVQGAYDVRTGAEPKRLTFELERVNAISAEAVDEFGDELVDIRELAEFLAADSDSTEEEMFQVIIEELTHPTSIYAISENGNELRLGSNSASGGVPESLDEADHVDVYEHVPDKGANGILKGLLQSALPFLAP